MRTRCAYALQDCPEDMCRLQHSGNGLAASGYAQDRLRGRGTRGVEVERGQVWADMGEMLRSLSCVLS